VSDTAPRRTTNGSPQGGLRLFGKAAFGAGASRGRVLLVHGYGEHAKRHAEIASALTAAGFSVWAGDLPGHGEAAGKRGHVRRWEDYLSIVESWWEALPAAPAPFFLLGHSVGGLIALDWAGAHPERPRGLLLSSPAFRLGFEPPAWRQALARVVARIWPSFSQPSGIETEGISTVREEVKRYRDDPLCHDRATARFFVSYLAAAARLRADTRPLPCPTLVLFGEDDPISSLAAARAWVGAHRDAARLLTFPEARHELFHESFVVREAAVQAVVEFFDSRLR